MKLRKLTKMQTINDGSRTLHESALNGQLVEALTDWASISYDSVLIGSLALSYYVKPRFTGDLNFLFHSNADLPTVVQGFKKTRAHAFQHNRTHAEVELVTPELVNIPPGVAKAVFETATTSDTIRITSPAGLVALKLFRFSKQDIADIDQLIRFTTIDLSGFGVPQDKLDRFLGLVAEVEAERSK